MLSEYHQLRNIVSCIRPSFRSEVVLQCQEGLLKTTNDFFHVTCAFVTIATTSARLYTSVFALAFQDKAFASVQHESIMKYYV